MNNWNNPGSSFGGLSYNSDGTLNYGEMIKEGMLYLYNYDTRRGGSSNTGMQSHHWFEWVGFDGKLRSGGY